LEAAQAADQAEQRLGAGGVLPELTVEQGAQPAEPPLDVAAERGRPGLEGGGAEVVEGGAEGAAGPDAVLLLALLVELLEVGVEALEEHADVVHPVLEVALRVVPRLAEGLDELAE
ncbi:MAG: hypothetical protein ACK559_37170, partial [bacterium]